MQAQNLAVVKGLVSVAWADGHVSAEETEVLPAARVHLTPEDWASLDAAFAANRDPMTGHSADEAYAPLFQQILMHAPAPIGLG